MARPLRPNIPGGIYHVMARGNERKPIYFDDEDREGFLELLRRTVRSCRWDCLAYCLMANHYHLVIRTPLPNLSRGMRLLNGTYASRINARYERVGHLFQGRFRSVLVRNSVQLLIVMRYVLTNPVRAGLCASPGEWRWSSFRATATRQGGGLVAADAALAWFGDDDAACEQFTGFIAHDLNALDLSFSDEVELPCETGNPLHPRPSLEKLLRGHPDMRAIALAYHEYGYSLYQIAALLGWSRSTVGRRLVAYDTERMLDSAT